MENVLPEIFNSTIVNARVDEYWDLGRAKELVEKDTLVISLPFAANSAEENQLHKMLGACKLSSEHFQILQLKQDESVAWYQLREQTKASKVLLLGILPMQLGIQAMMVPHEVNNFDNTQWMPTFALEQISSNDALKKHLWVNVFQKVYF